MNYEIKIEFITPCFSHGASGVPEIRPASIRGMLHHWFRLLGGTIEQERAVFGGVKQKKILNAKDSASKVVVRVKDIHEIKGEDETLPHKHGRGKEASPRKAYLSGTKFTLVVSDRLNGLQGRDACLFRDALHAWLLMGTLGFRSTRAGGSFIFDSIDFPSPASPKEYEAECRGLLKQRNAPMRVAVLANDFKDAASPRCVISNSLGGNGRDRGPESLQKLRDPLGRIKPKRKTSPLKFRILRFGPHYRILATWDDREEVTGNRPSDLHDLIDVLVNHPKPIGQMLKTSSLYDKP